MAVLSEIVCNVHFMAGDFEVPTGESPRYLTPIKVSIDPDLSRNQYGDLFVCENVAIVITM